MWNDPPLFCFLALSFSLSFFSTCSSRRSRGEFHWPSSGALTSPLSGLSYGRHYRRAHASISHSRSSEPRTSENLHERAITPRVHNHFFRSGILLRMSVVFFGSRAEALTRLRGRFHRFTLALNPREYFSQQLPFL